MSLDKRSNKTPSTGLFLDKDNNLFDYTQLLKEQNNEIISSLNLILHEQRKTNELLTEIIK